jgi:hypothetical protein
MEKPPLNQFCADAFCASRTGYATLCPKEGAHHFLGKEFQEGIQLLAAGDVVHPAGIFWNEFLCILSLHSTPHSDEAANITL